MEAATTRGQRHRNPSAKQRQNEEEAAQRLAAKANPKPRRDDPAVVQKKRQVASGTISSQTVALERRSVTKPKATTAPRRPQPRPVVKTPATSQAPKRTVPQSAPPRFQLLPAGKENIPLPQRGSDPRTLFDDDIADAERDTIRARNRQLTRDLPASSDDELDGEEGMNNGMEEGNNMDSDARHEDEEQATNNDGNNGGYDSGAEGDDDPGAEDHHTNTNNRKNNNADDDGDTPSPYNSEDEHSRRPKTHIKRPRSTSYDADDELSTNAKRSRTRDNRPNRSDFGFENRSFINLACSLYEVQIATRCLYPDLKTEEEMVADTWVAVCERMDVSFRMTPEISTLLTRLATHFRSQFRDVARKVVKDAYGFVTSDGKPDLIEQNKVLAAKLLTALSFTRPLSELEKLPSKRRALYENIAILRFLCATLFRKKNRKSAPGLAIRFPIYFGPRISDETLAWIITMLKYGIKEWVSGTCEEAVFYEAEWSKVYFDHVADIKKYSKKMAKFQRIEKITANLVRDARAAAGLGPFGNVEAAGTLTAEALDDEYELYEAEAAENNEEEDQE